MNSSENLFAPFCSTKKVRDAVHLHLHQSRTILKKMPYGCYASVLRSCSIPLTPSKKLSSSTVSPCQSQQRWPLYDTMCSATSLAPHAAVNHLRILLTCKASRTSHLHRMHTSICSWANRKRVWRFFGSTVQEGRWRRHHSSCGRCVSWPGPCSSSLSSSSHPLHILNPKQKEDQAHRLRVRCVV